MSPFDARSFLAAAAAAVVVAGAVGLAARPPRRLSPRMRPFAQLARSRLGAGSADAAVLQVDGPAGHPVARVLAPPLHRLSAISSTPAVRRPSNSASTRPATPT